MGDDYPQMARTERTPGEPTDGPPIIRQIKSHDPAASHSALPPNPSLLRRATSLKALMGRSEREVENAELESHRSSADEDAIVSGHMIDSAQASAAVLDGSSRLPTNKRLGASLTTRDPAFDSRSSSGTHQQRLSLGIDSTQTESILTTAEEDRRPSLERPSALQMSMGSEILLEHLAALPQRASAIDEDIAQEEARAAGIRESSENELCERRPSSSHSAAKESPDARREGRATGWLASPLRRPPLVGSTTAAIRSSSAGSEPSTPAERSVALSSYEAEQQLRVAHTAVALSERSGLTWIDRLARIRRGSRQAAPEPAVRTHDAAPPLTNQARRTDGVSDVEVAALKEEAGGRWPRDGRGVGKELHAPGHCAAQGRYESYHLEEDESKIHFEHRARITSGHQFAVLQATLLLVVLIGVMLGLISYAMTCLDGFIFLQKKRLFASTMWVCDGSATACDDPNRVPSSRALAAAYGVFLSTNCLLILVAALLTWARDGSPRQSSASCRFSTTSSSASSSSWCSPFTSGIDVTFALLAPFLSDFTLVEPVLKTSFGFSDEAFTLPAAVGSDTGSVSDDSSEGVRLRFAGTAFSAFVSVASALPSLSTFFCFFSVSGRTGIG